MSAENFIVTSGLDTAVYEALKQYVDDFKEESTAMLRRSANRCKATLKATSPRGNESKHYADGWSVKDVSDNYTGGFVIYNRTKPGLAHLLNDGHVAKNKFGTYGFVRGDGHINKAEKDAVEYLMEQLSKAGAL